MARAPDKMWSLLVYLLATALLLGGLSERRPQFTGVRLRLDSTNRPASGALSADQAASALRWELGHGRLL